MALHRGVRILLNLGCLGWAGSAGCAEDASAGLPAPTLTEVRETVLTPSCVLGRCHVTSAPAGGLSLTGRDISVHEALVNVRARGAPDRLLVVPHVPEASYLVEKLTQEAPSAGQPMPPLGRLAQADIDRVRRWILAGALDN